MPTGARVTGAEAIVAGAVGAVSTGGRGAGAGAAIVTGAGCAGGAAVSVRGADRNAGGAVSAGLPAGAADQPGAGPASGATSTGTGRCKVGAGAADAGVAVCQPSAVMGAAVWAQTILPASRGGRTNAQKESRNTCKEAPGAAVRTGSKRREQKYSVSRPPGISPVQGAGRPSANAGLVLVIQLISATVRPSRCMARI